MQGWISTKYLSLEKEHFRYFEANKRFIIKCLWKNYHFRRCSTWRIPWVITSGCLGNFTFNKNIFVLPGVGKKNLHEWNWNTWAWGRRNEGAKKRGSKQQFSSFTPHSELNHSEVLLIFPSIYFFRRRGVNSTKEKRMLFHFFLQSHPTEDMQAMSKHNTNISKF